MIPVVRIMLVILLTVFTVITTSVCGGDGGCCRYCNVCGFVEAFTTTNNNNNNNNINIPRSISRSTIRNSNTIFLVRRTQQQQNLWNHHQQERIRTYTTIRRRTSTTARTATTRLLSTNTNNNNNNEPVRIVDDWDKGIIPYGEVSRKYRRDVFAYGDWVKHRSDNRRFISNPSDIFNSGIVRQLSKECIITGSIATFIVVYNALCTSIGYDDWYGIHHDPILTLPPFVIPTIFFTLTSPALSFLLIFKTNTSYQRWDEGRKNWGSIVNSSRTILRECSAWLVLSTTAKSTTTTTTTTTILPPPPPDTDDSSSSIDNNNNKRRYMGRLAAAVWLFPRSMTRHLLSSDEDDVNYATDCQANLNTVLANDMIAARHKPTRSLYELSCAINAFPFGDYRRIAIDHAVTALCDAMGSNERIFTSPVPRFYTKHLNRFLQVWLVVLPLTLYPAFADTWNHWFCIPATIIISFFLLGIEELGIQLEEPFTVLPMHKITNGIGLSAEEHLQWFLNDNTNTNNNNNNRNTNK